MVNSAEPSATSACVRMPAAWLRTSRSKPSVAPAALATTSRRRRSAVASMTSGRPVAGRAERVEAGEQVEIAIPGGGETGDVALLRRAAGLAEPLPVDGREPLAAVAAGRPDRVRPAEALTAHGAGVPRVADRKTRRVSTAR